MNKFQKNLFNEVKHWLLYSLFTLSISIVSMNNLGKLKSV